MNLKNPNTDMNGPGSTPGSEAEALALVRRYVERPCREAADFR
ncbi:MAG: hypothetical protein ACRDHK_00240 [Actinomycetota bacterium]